MPREYTEEEVRQKFLEQVWHTINYWLNESGRPDAKDKLEGLAFSLLANIDGDSVAIPGFVMTPNNSPEDKDYYESHGQNWYPDDCDIAGCLHEKFHDVGRRLGYIK